MQSSLPRISASSTRRRTIQSFSWREVKHLALSLLNSSSHASHRRRSNRVASTFLASRPRLSDVLTYDPKAERSEYLLFIAAVVIRQQPRGRSLHGSEASW